MTLLAHLIGHVVTMAEVEGSPAQEFKECIISNGGDANLIEVLESNGFSSKLSLKKNRLQLS